MPCKYFGASTAWLTQEGCYIAAAVTSNVFWRAVLGEGLFASVPRPPTGVGRLPTTHDFSPARGFEVQRMEWGE